MRIYTKTGDKGETSLFNGKRVQKDSEYIEGYGTIDELNSTLGLTLSFSKEAKLSSLLKEIQRDLFEIGTDLATPFDHQTSKAAQEIERFSEKEITKLEQWINEHDAKLPPLHAFILPGGTETASFLHLSRTVCRRAERWITKLCREGKANPAILIYINRLSDLLFVLARYVNHTEGKVEISWQSRYKKQT